MNSTFKSITAIFLTTCMSVVLATEATSQEDLAPRTEAPPTFNLLAPELPTITPNNKDDGMNGQENLAPLPETPPVFDLEMAKREPDMDSQDGTSKKTYKQILMDIGAQEKAINKLFSTIPIGFPAKQREHMAKIEQLREQNKILVTQLESAAFEAFKQDPQGSPLAAQFVFKTLVGKLEASGPDFRFDPQGANEIASMMLTAIENADLTSSGIPIQQIAYQAFLASFAVEDYDRADLMLQKLEETKLPLSAGLRVKLTDAQTKWERELMARRLEANTDDLPRVKFETTEGEFTAELFENHAPKTVGNFISLVEKNFYNGMTFFIVRPGLFAQCGCSIGDGSGDPGYNIPCECNQEEIRHHFTGTLSMSNHGPDTGGSQFFVTQQRIDGLDEKYTAFGRVIEGMDVIYKLRMANPKNTQVDSSELSTIIKATVLRKRDHPYEASRIIKTPESSSSELDSDGNLNTPQDETIGG